jgi:molybdopterin/thiamine biosynthesis adenylyltransferase
VNPAGTRILVVGAGGLGGPIALALAGGGASLLLCDPDVVDLSNLQRQVQFAAADVGRLKVDALADALAARGVDRRRIETVPEALTAANADQLIAAVDLVIDGSDSPETKFLVNDRSLAAGVRFVIAAAIRWGGHVIAVRPGQDGCYRCLFETPPADAASCSSAGVIGAAVGVIAGHAVRATHSTPDGAEILVFDDLRVSLEPRRVGFHRRRDCRACAGAAVPVKEAS